MNSRIAFQVFNGMVWELRGFPQAAYMRQRFPNFPR